MAIDWPLATNVIRRNSVSNTFGMVRNGGKRAHQGWDFYAPVGTDTFAISSGTIEVVTGDVGDYGISVCLKFTSAQGALFAWYAHLDEVFVTKGQTVALGERIATTGMTGNAKKVPALADQHLHFEIREKALLGKGLKHRMSPVKVFGVCPLKTTAHKKLGVSAKK